MLPTCQAKPKRRNVFPILAFQIKRQVLCLEIIISHWLLASNIAVLNNAICKLRQTKHYINR